MPLKNEMDFYDCFTEAEEIRTIKTAIEQSLDVIGTGPVTKEQDAALYTIKLLCSALDTAADILDEIGRRDGDE